MRVRTRRSLRSVASAAMAWLVYKLEDFGLGLLRLTERRRKRRDRQRPAMPSPPAHADERAGRRLAEAEHGGLSTDASNALYASGANPGGMHHKAVRREEGPEHPRPEQEEPQERKERVPGGEHYMAAIRRGS